MVHILFIYTYIHTVQLHMIMLALTMHFDLDDPPIFFLAK